MATTNEQNLAEGGSQALSQNRQAQEEAATVATIVSVVAIVACLLCCLMGFCRRRRAAAHKAASRSHEDDGVAMSGLPTVTFPDSTRGRPGSLEAGSLVDPLPASCHPHAGRGKPPPKSTSFSTVYQSFRRAGSSKANDGDVSPKHRGKDKNTPEAVVMLRHGIDDASSTTTPSAAENLTAGAIAGAVFSPSAPVVTHGELRGGSGGADPFPPGGRAREGEDKGSDPFPAGASAGAGSAEGAKADLKTDGDDETKKGEGKGGRAEEAAARAPPMPAGEGSEDYAEVMHI